MTQQHGGRGARPSLRDLSRLHGTPATAEEQPDVALCEALRFALLQSDQPIGDVFEQQGGRHDVTTVAAETSTASSTPERALFLYRLVRALRPSLVVEFGSALGVSGSYVACALRANGSGRFVTVEGSPSRHAVAAASIESVAPGVTTARCGYFDEHLDVLDGAELFFNDGNHHEEPVLAYAEAALARMARPGVLVLDDALGYSTGMTAAWNRLRRDRRFAASATAGPMGLLALDQPRRGLLRR